MLSGSGFLAAAMAYQYHDAWPKMAPFAGAGFRVPFSEGAARVKFRYY